MRVPNDYNLYFARYGVYGGRAYTFTHRDPQTGNLWGEDIPEKNDKGKVVAYGMWVPGDKVRFLTDSEVEGIQRNARGRRRR